MGYPMPTLGQIVTYWRDNWRETFPDLRATRIGWAEPFCFRCGWLSPSPDPYASDYSWKYAAGWLERAHLVDHCAGGPDIPENLVPLCLFCHRSMHVYQEKEDRSKAIEWIRLLHDIKSQAPARSESWQMFTDFRYGCERYQRCPGFNQLFVDKSDLDILIKSHELTK